MHTSAIHSKSIEVPRMISANNSASVSSNISSIHSSGMKETLPLNSEKNVSTGTPLMRKEELHRLNNQKQAQKIAHLLGGDITVDMVKHALNFDGMGDLNQQAMNYRPESSLVVLTLLEPHEMEDGLLASAAKMVKDLNQTTNDTYKVILKSSLKQFDKKLQQSLFGIKGDNFLIMSERFKEIYIKPKFENILKPYLSENIIKQLSMDDCLLSLENKRKQEKISVLNDAYQKEGNTPSVDKAHYMHSMFSILEESLEIIKTLKTTVDWQEHSPPSNLENSPLHVADEVDGAAGLPQSKTSSQHHISGSYNTTNNYYFSSPLSENITKISYKDPEVDHSSPEESKPTKQSEDPVLAPVKNQFIAKLPRTILNQSAKEPEVDYEFPKVNNSIYQSKGFVASTLRGNQDTQAKVKSGRQSAKQDAIQQFLPKNGHLLGSYLRNGEVPAKVTLSTEGALIRSQSDKEIYRGTREVTKVVVDTASYLPNSETPVTLTERGALTRDQSKKDAYTTGQ
ncbi:hypothetical protein [Providencia vermicola]|uniref:hypothetical protein n=1 Tax=Providencia vermicola TaxID=333965 RepID=UPI001CEDB314|nr:hypothetical protein [Providencia vermicola]